MSRGLRRLRRSRGPLLGLLACALLAPPAAADEASADAAEAGWRTVREEDGIVLARRDGGDTPMFRAVTVVEATLPQVLAVLRDVPRHVEWRSRLAEARVLERPSERVAILYNRIEGAWPVADRDTVLRSETRVEGPNVVHIELSVADSSLAPDPDGAVRVPRLDGRYSLEALGSGRTQVEYRMRIDLGGSVPGWLVRVAAEDMPLETLAGLREQVVRTGEIYGAFAAAWPEAAARGEIPSLP